MNYSEIFQEENEAIESTLVTRAIENAQRKVEGHNFDIRKHLLEFDDVANDQRKVIYEKRNDLLDDENVNEDLTAMRHDVINNIISNYIPPGSIDEMWNIHDLTEVLDREMGINLNISGWLAEDPSLHEESLRERILNAVDSLYHEKEKIISPEILHRVEKQIMLDVLDRHWKEHLIAMDHLRQGINLRSYAAKNPKQEYKREAFEMFLQMLEDIKYDVISFLSKVQVRTEEDIAAAEQQHPKVKNINYNHPAAPNALSGDTTDGEPESGKAPFVRGERKIGRNEPCPCGSGKKFKQCHGKLN